MAAKLEGCRGLCGKFSTAPPPFGDFPALSISVFNFACGGLWSLGGLGSPLMATTGISASFSLLYLTLFLLVGSLLFLCQFGLGMGLYRLVLLAG